LRAAVDVIVTGSGTAAIAAKRATQAIPIVMAGSGDAVAQGLVASLARPGGNVTGVTMISPETSRKRLEVIHELLPGVSRVGILWCGGVGPIASKELSETQSAADTLKVQLSPFEIGHHQDMASAHLHPLRSNMSRRSSYSTVFALLEGGPDRRAFDEKSRGGHIPIRDLS
jgi:putative ABC transport system substrate-binding protein